MKFTLGTVQFGLDYGVANSNGKPNQEAVYRLLDRAVDLNIDYLDTAMAYGDSQKVLGNWYTDKEKPPVISKVNQLTPGQDENGYYSELCNKLSIIFNELQCDHINGLMLHYYYLLEEGGDALYKALMRLKNEGFVDEVGVSLYTGEELRKALVYEELTIFQCPMNLFDNPLLGINVQNKKIFVRSVYLQGLFFLSPEEAESKVPESGQYLKKLLKIAEREGLASAELAFRYVLSEPNVYSLVLGVDNEQQLLENCQNIKLSPLSEELRSELNSVFKDVPEKVKNPSLWSKE